MTVDAPPIWLQAGFWGLVAGSALVIGAALAYLVRWPARVISGIMAFGAGVLISALSFDLMDEALASGGFLHTAGGFLTGGAIYTGANIWLNARGARHRKRAGMQQAAESEKHGEDNAGQAIALGALLDGAPEAVVIGVSLLGGAGVSLTAVAAVFLSNVPEGLASVAGMRKAGRSPVYVFGVWGAIALASGIAAALGALLLQDASAGSKAFVNGLAAGAILAMLADTMIPEAFAHAHDYAGLITVVGFLAAFALSKLGD